MEDDNVRFQDPTFGTVQLEVNGNSPGIGFDVERRLSKLIGLEETSYAFGTGPDRGPDRGPDPGPGPGR